MAALAALLLVALFAVGAAGNLSVASLAPEDHSPGAPTAHQISQIFNTGLWVRAALKAHIRTIFLLSYLLLCQLPLGRGVLSPYIQGCAPQLL